MSIGRVNSVAHNFGHHFLWFRKGFVYANIARKAQEAKIETASVDILRERITPAALDTPVFRHVIRELRSKFYNCLDSALVDHNYVASAEIYVDSADYPARRCCCVIHDRYGHAYSQDVEIKEEIRTFTKLPE